MTGPDTPVREFVTHIRELAVVDSSRAWLEAMSDAGAIAASATAGQWPTTALIAAAHDSGGGLVGGRLTGRWTSVVGARYADRFLLPVRGGTNRHVVVARDSVRVDIGSDSTALRAAGLADVTASDVVVSPADVFAPDPGGPVLTVTGATATMVGSAQGLWLRHVEQLRSHLAAHPGGTTADSDAAQVARAASDIDAAELQLTESAAAEPDLEVTVWVCRQVVARARSAADRLLEHSRHALDADDPATRRWGEVDAGARLAVRVFDAAAASLR